MSDRRWHVPFKLEGCEWSWVSVEADHPAGAKKVVHDRLGGHVLQYATPTLTDRQKTLKDFKREFAASLAARTIRDIFEVIDV